MSKTQRIGSPRIESIKLINLVDSNVDDLEPYESHDGERYSSIDLSHRDFTGTTFTECEFLDLSAHETNFRAASFVDTKFERLKAPIFKAPRSRFRDVAIDGSRLGSAEFYDASWQSVHISHSKIGYINLRNAELIDVLFTNCIIDELDFGGAKANRVSFVNTTVDNLDFTQTRLQNVDLRTLEIRRISGVESLKGTVMTSQQTSELAPLFAEHFGINVTD